VVATVFAFFEDDGNEEEEEREDMVEDAARGGKTIFFCIYFYKLNTGINRVNMNPPTGRFKLNIED